jgi:hypothetical protein
MEDIVESLIAETVTKRLPASAEILVMGFVLYGEEKRDCPDDQAESGFSRANRL